MRISKWPRTMQGAAECGELVKEADAALEKAREQEADETRLEDWRDKLMNLADTMNAES